MTKRLYTFGCSFTSYFYPTWADFVGSQFDIYENWGQSGAGNFYIASQVYECNQINKFTSEDTVLVMFTNYTRYDMIDNDSQFLTCGNIYSQGCYDDNFIQKYWSPEHGFYTTWFSINSVYNLLKNIGCKFKLMTAFDLRLKDQYSGILEEEFSKPRMNHCYENLSEILPHVNLKDYTNEKISYYFENKIDFHPTLVDHFNWVKNYMNEFYNPNMSNLLIDWEKMITKNEDVTRNNFLKILDKPFKRFTSTPINKKLI